jgi:hypothetical protein
MVRPLKTIAIREGEKITEHENGKVTFISKAAIDGDGTPENSHNDPCWQPSTSLKFNGQSVNADLIPYVTVPPIIIRRVRGIVLGCRARITNLVNQLSCLCVVADIGPENKIGEISVAAAKAIGINPSPTSGGEADHIIQYELWPGIPAVIGETTFHLQPYR